MALTLADLLAAPFKTVKVETPIGEVFVSELSTRELRTWLGDKEEGKEKAKLVALSLSDEKGVALADLTQVDALNGLPDSVLQPIYLAALRLNGLIAEEKTEDPKGD